MSMLPEFLANRLEVVLAENQKLYQSLIEFKKLLCPSIWTSISPQQLYVDLYTLIGVNGMMKYQDVDLIFFRKDSEDLIFILDNDGNVLKWNKNIPSNMQVIYAIFLEGIGVGPGYSGINIINPTFPSSFVDYNRELYKKLSSMLSCFGNKIYIDYVFNYFKTIYADTHHTVKQIAAKMHQHEKINDQFRSNYSGTVVFSVKFNDGTRNEYILGDDGIISSRNWNIQMPRIGNSCVNISTMHYMCCSSGCQGIANEPAFYDHDDVLKNKVFCSKCNLAIQNKILIDENTKLKKDIENLMSQLKTQEVVLNS